jgi:hypothetical protein
LGHENSYETTQKGVMVVELEYGSKTSWKCILYRWSKNNLMLIIVDVGYKLEFSYESYLL